MNYHKLSPPGLTWMQIFHYSCLKIFVPQKKNKARRF
jgi:hypothetical protein